MRRRLPNPRLSTMRAIAYLFKRMDFQPFNWPEMMQLMADGWPQDVQRDLAQEAGDAGAALFAGVRGDLSARLNAQQRYERNIYICSI